jgi:hypothetical protein
MKPKLCESNCFRWDRFISKNLKNNCAIRLCIMWNVARSNLSDGLELETMSVDESTVDISALVFEDSGDLLGVVCM